MLNALKTRTSNSLFIHRFWDKIAPRVERDHRSNVLVLTGRAMLNTSIIQFSVDGQGCLPSLLFDLRPNHGGGNEVNGDLLQNVLC